MSTLINLGTVRFYNDGDVYHWTVDNRPLQDLNSNDAILANAINRAGPQLSTVTSSTVTAPSGAQVTLFYNQPLTSNATVTAAADPQNGDILRVVRSANVTGAYSITFNGKSLTTAATSITWQFDGLAWQEIGYNTLI